MVNEPSVFELLRFDCSEFDKKMPIMPNIPPPPPKIMSQPRRVFWNVRHSRHGNKPQNVGSDQVLDCLPLIPLRKHAYSNILKLSPTKKTEGFQIKILIFSDIFHISAQNINCGYSLEPPRRCGSNGYPQSMF